MKYEKYKPEKEYKEGVFPDGKSVRRLRITLCVFFFIIATLVSMPFVVISNGQQQKAITVLDLIGRSFLSGEVTLGIVSCVFLIIPIVAFFFAVFDRSRQFKAAAGILASAAGVISILLIVTPVSIAFGSMLSLVLYIVTFIISVMLLMGKSSERHMLMMKKEEREQEKEHMEIKIGKDGTATAKPMEHK
ncbi:MAG: hypothetical protein ACI4I4_06345 [Acutalibacteraceae bacterium]